MNNKFFLYALSVTLVATFASWLSLADEATGGSGSNWSSRSSSGHGSFGSDYSGGHK